MIWSQGPSSANGVRVWHQWTPVFRGRFVARDGGRTGLEGRIGINRFVPAFAIVVALVVGGWLVSGLAFVFDQVQQGAKIGAMTAFANLVLPAVFGLFLALLLSAGIRLFERDRQELEGFLREALGGGEDEDPAAAR